MSDRLTAVSPAVTPRPVREREETEMTEQEALGPPNVTGGSPSAASRRRRTASVVRTCIALAVLAAALPWMGTSSAKSAPAIDPVRSWNEQALTTARRVPLSDAQAARLYAMVNVAMYDAVNGIAWQRGNDDRRHEAIVDPRNAPPEGDEYAAAVGAAHAVLAGGILRARVTTTRNATPIRAVATRTSGPPGFAWGTTSDRRSARHARTTARRPEPGPIGSGIGHFRAMERRAVPQARSVRDRRPVGVRRRRAGRARERGIRGGLRHREGPWRRPADRSAEAGHFRYWSLGDGTSQPPGAWIQVALRVTDDIRSVLPTRRGCSRWRAWRWPTPSAHGRDEVQVPALAAGDGDPRSRTRRERRDRTRHGVGAARTEHRDVTGVHLRPQLVQRGGRGRARRVLLLRRHRVHPRDGLGPRRRGPVVPELLRRGGGGWPVADLRRDPLPVQQRGRSRGRTSASPQRSSPVRSSPSAGRRTRVPARCRDQQS